MRSAFWPGALIGAAALLGAVNLWQLLVEHGDAWDATTFAVAVLTVLSWWPEFERWRR